jgi:hypothetical protein
MLMVVVMPMARPRTRALLELGVGVVLGLV